LTEPVPGEAATLVDLTSVTLEQIARLCGSSVGSLDADDIADRPVLRRALLRVRQDSERNNGLFAGFSSHL
jgi:hypothetical protein